MAQDGDYGNLREKVPSEKEVCTVPNLFSIFGKDKDPRVVYYTVYEFGVKATTLSFNVATPLLISTLGDDQFGFGNGRIVYVYLTSLISICTALSFLTGTSIMEYGMMKRKALVRFSIASAFALCLFVFCFSAGSTIIACVLMLIAKVCLSISGLAHDSLLHAVAKGKDAHQINARSYSTGYSGMIAYILLFLLPIYATFNFAFSVKSTLWLEGILPNVTSGLWLLFFTVLVNNGLPSGLGKGFPFTSMNMNMNMNNTQNHKLNSVGGLVGGGGSGLSGSIAIEESTKNKMTTDSEMESGGSDVSASAAAAAGASNELSSPTDDEELHGLSISETAKETEEGSVGVGVSPQGGSSIFAQLLFGLQQGFKLQVDNIQNMSTMPDLSLFLGALVFLFGAANTSYSVSAIVAVKIMGLGIEYVVASTFIGIFAAIAGLAFYRWLHHNKYLSAKWILISNIICVAGLSIFVLFVNTPAMLFMLAAGAGSQIGSIGSFSKSTISKLAPRYRQSRIFSLYQFSQEATGWIGPLIVASLATTYQGSEYVKNRGFVISAVQVCLTQVFLGVPLLLMVDLRRGKKRRVELEMEDKADYLQTTHNHLKGLSDSDRRKESGKSYRSDDSDSNSQGYSSASESGSDSDEDEGEDGEIIDCNSNSTDSSADHQTIESSRNLIKNKDKDKDRETKGILIES